MVLDGHTRRYWISVVAGLAASVRQLRGASKRQGRFAQVGSPADRKQQAFEIRQEAALRQRELPLTQHEGNGDEQRYSSRIASFSKCMPHNTLGEVDLNAYDAYLRALESGESADFEAIPMGGTAKLIDPEAAYSYQLEGCDPHQPSLRPPPTFDSAEQAAEMAELYWLALTRDIPFAEYERSSQIAEAAADLSSYSDYRAPKAKGRVTAETIFRGSSPGELQGPYISQFFSKTIPYGTSLLPQIYRTAPASLDFLTDRADWLANQRGLAPANAIRFDGTPRYIRSGRDLALWLYRDFTYQAFQNAALILFGAGQPVWSNDNPYKRSRSRASFVTFGPPHVLDLVARASNAALKATWCQKWLIHRRIRPEGYAGRVDAHVSGAAQYPIHSELLSSPVLRKVASLRGTYLLPMPYPEGAPAHPSYPAGHAAIAGACVTILKAFFEESAILPDPVVASSDGLTLEPYLGPPLTVGGELNKLAANVALGRDTAGVHYRSDGVEGLRLGEAVALSILQDELLTFSETMPGWKLTRFDGTPVRVGLE